MQASLVVPWLGRCGISSGKLSGILSGKWSGNGPENYRKFVENASSDVGPETNGWVAIHRGKQANTISKESAVHAHVLRYFWSGTCPVNASGAVNPRVAAM